MTKGAGSPGRIRWIPKWSLGAVALGGASLGVPLYVVGLGGSPIALGALAATAAFVGVPGAFLLGRIADRTTRLVVLVEGVLLIVTAALVVLPFVENLSVILALNGAIWAAFAGAGPVLHLLVVAGAEEAEWQTRIARLNTFQGLGWAGGLVLGAIWTFLAEPRLGGAEAQRAFFFLCAACSALAALGLAFHTPGGSALRGLDPRRLRTALLQSPRMNIRGATFPFTPGRAYDWAFRAVAPRALAARFTVPLSVYYMAVLLFFAGFAVFFAPLPIFLDEAGFPSGAIFALYLVSSLGAALSFGTAGRMAGRHNLGGLQAAGLLLRGGTIPLVALVGPAAGAAALPAGGFAAFLFLLIGGTWAVISVTGATLVVRLAPVGVRGEALGLYAATGALAGGIGSLGGGWLAAASYGLAFGVAGGLVVAGALLVLSLRGAVARADELRTGSSPSDRG